MSQEKKGHK